MIKFFACFGIAIGILVLDALFCLFLAYIGSDKNGDVLGDWSIVMAGINTICLSVVLAIIIVEKVL